MPATSRSCARTSRRGAACSPATRVTAEGASLAESGWAATRSSRRREAGTAALPADAAPPATTAPDDPVARAARLPTAGLAGAHDARCRRRARARAGAAPRLPARAGLRPLPRPGPLPDLRRAAGTAAAGRPLGCRWCGVAAADWACPALRRSRSARGRRRRRADRGGARPGVPRRSRADLRRRRACSPTVPAKPARRRGHARRGAGRGRRLRRGVAARRLGAAVPAGPAGRRRRRCAAGSTRPRSCAAERTAARCRRRGARASCRPVQALLRWHPRGTPAASSPTGPLCTCHRLPGWPR